ncbi:MAG TPA: DUF131 domain-containing protein [Candidatus Bathyarchaeia archaeon]|nr:DUF131 domain-containing protein [Candidatus Bathyarchaeia archaeon]
MVSGDPARFFFKLLLLGFGLICTGMIIVIIASLSSGTSTAGGVIIIGPIPIIFGAGENAWELVMVASVLTIVCLLLFFLRKRRE